MQKQLHSPHGRGFAFGRGRAGPPGTPAHAVARCQHALKLLSTMHLLYTLPLQDLPASLRHTRQPRSRSLPTLAQLASSQAGNDAR